MIAVIYLIMICSSNPEVVSNACRPTMGKQMGSCLRKRQTDRTRIGSFRCVDYCSTFVQEPSNLNPHSIGILLWVVLKFVPALPSIDQEQLLRCPCFPNLVWHALFKVNNGFGTKRVVSHGRLGGHDMTVDLSGSTK